MVLGLRHETARGDNKEGDIESWGKCVPMFDIKSVSGSYTTDGKKESFYNDRFFPLPAH
jgi:hypothetical protein